MHASQLCSGTAVRASRLVTTFDCMQGMYHGLSALGYAQTRNTEGLSQDIAVSVGGSNIKLIGLKRCHLLGSS